MLHRLTPKHGIKSSWVTIDALHTRNMQLCLLNPVVNLLSTELNLLNTVVNLLNPVLNLLNPVVAQSCR